MITPLFLAAAVVVASLATSLGALLILSVLPSRRAATSGHSHLVPPVQQAIFLFEGRELVDATPAARSLLATLSGPGTDWTRLCSHLATQIPNFLFNVGTLAERGEFDLRDEVSGTFRVKAEWLGGLTRLTLADLSAGGAAIMVDGLSQRAQEDEIETLHALLGSAPMLVWKTNAEGAVIWAGASYLALAAERAGIDQDELTWPLPVLFPDLEGLVGAGPARRCLAAADPSENRWFSIYVAPTQGGRLHYALSAEDAVKAEQSLRDFIQTLTKTFAHLPIGLAVFNRDRQLALFNPALEELTGAPVEFLASRPTLFSFLDRLRETQVIPEPKDYGTWRQQMVDVEKAATHGSYDDTWTLPSGQTFHVNGRPHPDGAVAFLIEDITREITLTRRFRAEIEMGQSVVDAVEEAIVVFSPAGELILSNAAFDRLWDMEPSRTLGTITVNDCLVRWREKLLPSPDLADIRDFVMTIDGRAEWDADLGLQSGGMLSCRIQPLAGGATLVGFSRPVATRPGARRIRRRGHTVTA